MMSDTCIHITCYIHCVPAFSLDITIADTLLLPYHQLLLFQVLYLYKKMDMEQIQVHMCSDGSAPHSHSWVYLPYTYMQYLHMYKDSNPLCVVYNTTTAILIPCIFYESDIVMDHSVHLIEFLHVCMV